MALGALPDTVTAAATVLTLIGDLRAHDPGLSLAAIGRALAAGSAAALYDGFPLRMLKPVPFADVVATASYCAHIVAEELSRTLREPNARND